MPLVSPRLLGLLFLVTGCQRDLDGRACACVEGYSCCESDQRCYRVAELEQHCPKQPIQPKQSSQSMTCAPGDEACLGRDAAAPSADAATDAAMLPAADGGAKNRAPQPSRDASTPTNSLADQDAGDAALDCGPDYVERRRPCVSCSDPEATEQDTCVLASFAEPELRRVVGGDSTCSIVQDDDAGVAPLLSRLTVSAEAHGGIAPDARSAVIKKASAEIDNGSCQGKENHPVAAESLELTMLWTVTFTGQSSCKGIPVETYVCDVDDNTIKLSAANRCPDESRCDLLASSELYIPAAAGLRLVELTFQVAYTGKSYGRAPVDGLTMVATWKPQ